MTASSAGRFFEDFAVGQNLVHPTPRTVFEADIVLYLALYGHRHALFCASPIAKAAGFAHLPLDPVLVFHIVFGKSVPDISANAVANLGYAQGRVLAPVFAGDTLRAVSQVIGLKENANGKTGIVYVRTVGLNQHDAPVLEYARWVMVHKRDAHAPAPAALVPELPAYVSPDQLILPPGLDFAKWDDALAGSSARFGDYAIGAQIDHVDGMAVEEAEHQIATRLYQNTARVHFDAHAQASSRFGRRLIYGGVAISLVRALSFNGLGNAAWMLALNAGRHANPLFAGDTVYAWSQILDKAVLSEHIGALRVRHVGLKNTPAHTFPLLNADGTHDPNVILDLDLWLAIPI